MIAAIEMRSCSQLPARIGQAATRQQNAEFLAAETAEQIARPQVHSACLHGLFERVVAGGVTMLVVDRLA